MGLSTDNKVTIMIISSLGCKWTLHQLRRYFQQARIADWLLWQRISALVVLTVLSHVSQIPPTTNCFEFFGFDVLIDNALRPWLLEVSFIIIPFIHIFILLFIYLLCNITKYLFYNVDDILIQYLILLFLILSFYY